MSVTYYEYMQYPVEYTYDNATNEQATLKFTWQPPHIVKEKQFYIECLTDRFLAPLKIWKKHLNQ